MDKIKVEGIGGFFFRARDPEALAKWYAEHLGVDPVPADYGLTPWIQREGPTVLAPFPSETDYWAGGKQWMINFRVPDLDGLAGQLRAAGIAVVVDPQEYPNGRFATIADPEGNPIQLWEPHD